MRPSSQPHSSRRRRFLSTALAALVALPTALAAKAPLVPSTDLYPPLQFDKNIQYRSFAANDSAGAIYNVSTFAAPKQMNITNGIGMYAYNFIWRGKAYNKNRPLIVFYGSSASRCTSVADSLCVLNQGVYEGWPWALRQSSNFTIGVLADAGFGIVSVVTPYCFNATSNSVRNNQCTLPYNTHTLKHYRPELTIDILRKVKTTFGFDSTKVVGAGQSQGARGIMRLGTQYALAAASITGGNLEQAGDFFMQSLPFQDGNGGEGCLTLNNPNVNGRPCTQPMPTTMNLASAYTSSLVNIYASPGDSVANLTTMVQPTCDAINSAAQAAGRDIASNPACKIQVQHKPKAPGFDGPTHLGLMSYGYGLGDLNFLASALGIPAVTFPSNRR